MPTDTSVSIVVARCRALTNVARWNGTADQNTTGVASAPATQRQPVKWNPGTIEMRSSGTVSTAAGTSRRRTPAASSASGSSTSTSGTE